ncbi:MAG: hypothetical protein HQK69_03710 [Desulfamplus sp.]|nr:hypothetical protein [Desulfamplus sp.]
MSNSRIFLTIFIICIFSISSICKGADFNSVSNISLIDARQLKDDIANWVILDARPIKYWETSHIPGSISFSWENYTTTDENQIPYRILPPERMAKAFEKLGISAESKIVVYGDADKSWGGEGWACWVFAWLGHKGEVRLLKGGIQAWERNNYPLVDEVKENLNNNEQINIKDNKNIKTVKYIPNPTASINISAKEIFDNPDKYQLVDTRSTIEWFKGHLPNAVHIPWEDFFKGKDRTPLDSLELRNLLVKNGVILEKDNQTKGIIKDKDIRTKGRNIEKKVVYYCTGGIRSGYAWMVHNLAGYEFKDLPKAINFEGGMAEWEKVVKN